MDHILSSGHNTGHTEAFHFSATGPLSIPMTNDYLFRALLQRNNHVLIGLISSLLHLPPLDISSAVITNPIELGDTIDNKTFILDIRVCLNDNVIINLEMQVINEHNWTDRSLSCLCRSYDNLRPAEKYQTVRPVIQIGLLNFTLFPQHPEFYATYKFLNVKNYTLYSDKLRLCVLDLTRTDLATEEDRRYQINYWATLFKAATWEELKMLSQKNEYIGEAAETVYQLSQEEKIRMQCEAREDYYRTQQGWQDMLAQKDSIIIEKDSEIAQKDSIIIEKDSIITEKDSIITEKDSIITEKDNILMEKEAMLQEKDETIKSVTSEYDELLTWAKEHGFGS